MGLILVTGADLADDRVESLRVKLLGLPERTVDRDTAIAWMRDGHSLVPLTDDGRQQALQLVEVPVDDEGAFFLRTDNAKQASDTLPELPAASGSGS